ncbi:MAG: ATP-binding protein, partial [Bacteroidota bacterium]
AGAYVASQLVRFPRRAFWLRSMLLLTLVNTLLLYILAFRAMDEQRRLRVLDAATAFASNGDEQLVEVTKRTLSRLVSDPAVQTVIEGAPSAEPIAWPQDRNWIEGVPVVLPATYRIDMALFDAEGLLIDTRSFGRQDDVLEAMGDAYVRTQRAYASLASSRPSALIRPAPVTDTDASAFEGLAPVGEAGWALVRVEQELASYANAQLRGYATEENQLALAEFENGRLRRSAGKPFDRVRLPADVRRRLTETDEFWRTEDLHGDQYATYYRRFTARPEAGTPGAFLNVGKQVVVAARTRGIIPYDHLYYILRIAIAGLWLGGIVYVISFLVRRQHPRPAERFSFGERVQRSFLTVGVVAIFLMGFIGQQVIVRENRGAIQSRLERRLERVENILRLNARPGEALVDALNRIPIDDLSEQLSLELNVYDGAKLIATTRTPDETRRLVDRRLPVEAFEAVYLDGYERAFVRTDVQRGYSYTIGYRAFSNDRGEPERVIAVLTIPEQERIREERNRTTAYLFGALLLLLLVVLGTATVLANALSGPLMRLRGSMKRLGKGEYTGTLPVESRDEIGELTEAFNEMQGQLAESRRQLAQQERELAWREMARQVAHEIKNPLTPMKLSIQHLQRAYPAVSGDGGVGERGEAGRFDGLFQRITKTLIEQIDTLARIANEFSTFARLPRRMVEPLDLNEVIGEAIALQAGEAHVDIVPELASEPLVVEGDKEELRRAFINLIKNALQAMPAGGTVTVRTRLEGETAHAEVEDTGTGIPEEVRGKIFQPNFSTKTSGMGLGLALVKKTVDAMNGEIGFSTEEGRGTTFWMHFPVLRQEPVI